MSTIDNSSIEDGSTATAISTAELQRQLGESFKKLSLERLQMLADFAAYLANDESEVAT